MRTTCPSNESQEKLGGMMATSNMQTYLKLKEAADMTTDLTSKKAQEAMWDAYTTDVEVVEPPSLPYGGVHKGRENWLAMSKQMRSLWQQKVWIDHIWEQADDNLIILDSTMEWTANSTGKTVRFPAIEMLYFRDALICRIELFLQDTKLILDTLQASP
jgi:SnoaL-like domain